MGDILFQKNVPIFIRNQSNVEKKSYIHIYIQTAYSSQSRKELFMRLTEEKDANFFYMLHLTEDEYNRIKLEQGLVMDFLSFPAKLIEQLEMVLNEDCKDSPKRLIQLNVNNSRGSGTSCFDIISINDISRRACMSLQMLPGTESDINKYLAETVKSLKDINNNLLKKLEYTENELTSQLREAREALANRAHELTELRSDLSIQISDLNNKHAREFNGEKEKTYQMQTQMQQAHEKERRDLEQEHMLNIKTLERKYNEIAAYNKDLIESKTQLEYSIQNLKAQINSLEDDKHRLEQETQRLKDEIQAARKEHSKLLMEHAESERQMVQYRMKCAVQEQELKDKNDVLTLNSEQLQTERVVTQRLHGEISQKDQEIQKDKSAIKLLSNDVMKGREIIEKMKTELRNINDKLKLRTQITLQQEKLLDERQKDLDDLKKSHDSIYQKLVKKEEEVCKLEEELTKSNEIIQESKKILKKNESVITWLNKQITENQISNKAPEQFSSTTSNVNNSLKQNNSTPAFANSLSNVHFGRSAISSTTNNHQNFGRNIANQSENAQIDEKYLRPEEDYNSAPPGPRFYSVGQKFGNPNPSQQRYIMPQTRQSPPIASAYFPFKA